MNGDADHPVTDSEFEAWVEARNRKLARLQEAYETHEAAAQAIGLDMARIRSMVRKAQLERPGARLLKQPNDRPRPDGCYCKPGRCMAPIVMGRQMPCLDPAKAAEPPA